MKKILPQNYRRITAEIKKHASKHSGRYTISILVLESLLFIVLASLCAHLFLFYKNLQTERVEELKKLLYWEKQAVKFPNYPEAYYNSALHALKLGDNEKATEYIKKSLELNQDYELSRNLKSEVK
jgi:tetratricopeptide (TPR) repeat protein